MGDGVLIYGTLTCYKWYGTLNYTKIRVSGKSAKLPNASKALSRLWYQILPVDSPTYSSTKICTTSISPVHELEANFAFDNLAAYNWWWDCRVLVLIILYKVRWMCTHIRWRIRYDKDTVPSLLGWWNTEHWWTWVPFPQCANVEVRAVDSTSLPIQVTPITVRTVLHHWKHIFCRF